MPAVALGFSTHPDWDLVLWHPALGDVPRYATGLTTVGMDAGARIHLDRSYIEALRDGTPIGDPRVDRPRPGWEWVGEYVHAGNVEQTHG